MDKCQNKFKPAVDKRILLALAGSVWAGAGTILLSFSYSWLSSPQCRGPFIFAGTGLCLALVIHHFGFLKIVDKNVGRILPMEGKRCLFSFISWKSYLIIVVMVMAGIRLRHSSIPKPYLSIVYTGIGLALILSSFRYVRVALGQRKKMHN